MRLFWVIIVILFSTIFGFLLFLINRELLIVKLDCNFFDMREDIVDNSKNLILRKNIKFYYFKDEKFNMEQISSVWFSSKSENLKHLINNWLSFLHEERILDKKVYLESASVSHNGQEVYLSFDQTPLLRDWSIFNKLCFIESLLKTINSTKLGVQKIFFLVDHQVMEDDHLDFSSYWPIGGFLDGEYRC